MDFQKLALKMKNFDFNLNIDSRATFQIQSFLNMSGNIQIITKILKNSHPTHPLFNAESRYSNIKPNIEQRRGGGGGDGGQFCGYQFMFCARMYSSLIFGRV